MPNEPMVTIKDEQGNLKQVPLSQLSKQTEEHTLPTPVLDTQKDVAASDVPSAVVPEDVEDLAAMAQEQVETETVELQVASESAVGKKENTTDATVVSPQVQILSKNDSVIENTLTESKKETDDAQMHEATREVAQETPAPQPEQEEDAAAVEEDSLQHMTEEAPQALAVSSSKLPSMTTPNTHMFEHADAHAWDADDHGSLLDESLTNRDLAMPHEKKGLSSIAPLAHTEGKPAAPRMPVPLPQSSRSARPDVFAHTKAVPMTDIAKVPVSPIPKHTKTEPMGPVGELAAMTLDDFRRLGGRNEVGIKELQHKFTVLLDESVLLYMQGVSAWHRSPLYGQYKEVLATSVSSGQPISAVLSVQNGLTQEEFDALVSLQVDLRL